MRLFLMLAAFASAVSASECTAQQSASRAQYALLIGNTKYPDSEAPLKEPTNDARALADELRRQGFEVDVAENLSKDAMQRALTRAYGKINSGSALLLFFSGYGIQSNRQTYLLPVDAQVWAEPDVKRDGFALESILSEFNSRGAGVKIAILDASRRNPFERRFRSVSAGLAPVVTPAGTLVMYSAAPGAIAPEATADHGVFVAELIKQIGSSGSSAEEAFNRTRVGVSRATQSEQVPWLSSTLGDDFAFGRAAPQVASAPTSNQRPPAAIPPTTAAPAPSVPPVAAQPSPPPLAAIPLPSYPPAPVPTPVTPVAPSSSQAVALQQPSAKAPPDDRIIKDLDTRIRLNPNDGGALYRRGQLYANAGSYVDAVKDFDEVLRINPGDAEALNNRCWVNAVIGELQQAMRDCDRALELRPQYAEAFDSRGLVKLKLGLLFPAINDYDAALRLSPRSASSLFGRGLAKVGIGNKAAGESDIASAKALNPTIADDFASYGLRQ
jgi:hypothetical protein